MTPTQELAMEVLTARFRCGEAIWTFKSQHERVLRQLEVDDLVFVMHGIVDGTVRAGLTDKGKEMFCADGYVPPILRDSEAASV